jgi:ketosteroid isomerase-like protein
MITQEQISRLLEELGQALSRGDAKSVAEAWHVPALVLSDEGAIAVEGYPQIEAFFEKAIQYYRQGGIITAKAELGQVQALSENLVTADVRWLGFDEQGREKSSERSHYILQLDAEGRLGVRVALTRTK